MQGPVCIASEWIKQGGDTESEEGTPGQNRWRHRQNDCSHVSAGS